MYSQNSTSANSVLSEMRVGTELQIMDEVRKQEFFFYYNFMEVLSLYFQGMERSLEHQFLDGIALGKGGQS